MPQFSVASDSPRRAPAPVHVGVAEWVTMCRAQRAVVSTLLVTMAVVTAAALSCRHLTGRASRHSAGTHSLTAVSEVDEWTVTGRVGRGGRSGRCGAGRCGAGRGGASLRRDPLADGGGRGGRVDRHR